MLEEEEMKKTLGMRISIYILIGLRPLRYQPMKSLNMKIYTGVETILLR